MTGSDSADSPLERVAGAASSRATDAFGLLSDETRLAILLALWEEYEPTAETDAVSFSELQERVGTRDSGQFNYHLEKLVGHFVEAVDGGYELRTAGHRIIRAVIAGTGLERATLTPTELDMACHRCEWEPVEVGYRDETLYLTCPNCAGFMSEKFPRGTLAVWELDPAGLAGRSPEETLVAGAIAEKSKLRTMLEGLCPDCSGPVDTSLRICDDHDPSSGEHCPACGTRDRIRVDYVCTTCKNWTGGPVQAEIVDHPAVIAFYYDRGIDVTYDVDDGEAFKQIWALLWEQDHALVSEDPRRIRVTVPCDGDELRLLLDEELDVVDVERRE